MSFLSFLFGKKPKTETVDPYSPRQRSALDQILGESSSQLPQVFDVLKGLLSQSPEALEAFEAPAKRQFQEDIIPSIAERFSGIDAQKSSAFGQQLGQAGAALSENLASQRGGLQMQAIAQLLGLLQGGLGAAQPDQIRHGGSSGFLGNLGLGVGKSLFPAASLGLGTLGKLLR